MKSFNLLSVGMKTALLQAEATACASGLATVQFCTLVVYFIFFSHCKITTVVSFSGLLVTCLYSPFVLISALFWRICAAFAVFIKPKIEV